MYATLVGSPFQNRRYYLKKTLDCLDFCKETIPCTFNILTDGRLTEKEISVLLKVNAHNNGSAYLALQKSMFTEYAVPQIGTGRSPSTALARGVQHHRGYSTRDENHKYLMNIIQQRSLIRRITCRKPPDNVFLAKP